MTVFELTVGHQDADYIGNTNEIIQAALDRAAALGGGIVQLLPGRYVMNDSLHLRSNVLLRGQGNNTILWKPPSVTCSVLNSNGYGLYRMGLEQAQYSLATAIGLFKSVISSILIVVSYWLSYRFANYRIF